MRFRIKPTAFLVPLAVVAAGVGLHYYKSQGGVIGSASATAEPALPPGQVEAAAATPGHPREASAASARLCGSNTIGAELAPALAEDYLRSKGEPSPSRSTSGAAATVSGSIAGSPFSVEIRSGGTGTAFSEMAAGRCDIAMASRQATQEELASLGAGAAEHVLGLDGIAIVVNQQNPAASVTVQQVAQLFTGATRDWPGLGRPVEIVSFDEKSGTYDTFKKAVLGGADVAGSAKKFSSSSDVVRAVSASPGGVAFMSFSAARGVKILPVGESGTQPVAPDQWTVSRESYPLTRRLYLYTSTRFTRPAADSLVTFALSEPGQAAVARSGFVDLSVRAEQQGQAACGSACPPEYLKATWGAKRLSVDFRFQHGRAELDSRAMADLDRVSRFVSAGSSVRLVGFADSSGSPASNVSLSFGRAEAVRAELARRGFPGKVESHGLGAAMPVASNDTEDGRQRNRRVEVWVAGSP